MKRVYHKWWSPHLGRDMELLVFGHGSTKMLIFPTRLHRFYEYENMGMVEVLRPRLERGELELFCVDSVDSESLYASHLAPPQRLARHLAFEAYVLNEVIPLMRGQSPSVELMAHGCSLGAFHAINLVLRYPHLFRRAIAFSGRYDLTLSVDHFRDLFDGYRDETVLENTPTRFVTSVTCERLRHHWSRLDIQLAVGDLDPFRPNTEEFDRALTEQRIPHRVSYWNGRAHEPAAWREMAARLL